MVARYQNGNIGRFISQDRAFLNIGNNNFEQKYGWTLQQHLADPQSLNSYSYVNNNPLRFIDPNGEIIPVLVAAWVVAELAMSAYDTYDTISTVFSDASLSEKGITAGGFALGLVAPGGGYGKAGKIVNSIGDVRSIMFKGHTIQRHVGKSDSFLLSRLKDTPGLKSASTFYNQDVAESTISTALNQNKSQIDNWLRTGEKSSLELNYSGNKNIGRVAEKSTMKISNGKNATVILQREGSSYYVKTSYVNN